MGVVFPENGSPYPWVGKVHPTQPIIRAFSGTNTGKNVSIKFLEESLV